MKFKIEFIYMISNSAIIMLLFLHIKFIIYIVLLIILLVLIIPITESTFLIKEETRNIELKMYVDSNTKKMPLLKIVFLELKKYKEGLNNDYKKIRWLEFFGNKQYTSKPDDILIQADNLLNLRNWSKEEKLMYDEITRQQDHYWASLAYAQEEGRAEGRVEEKINTIISLLKRGYINRELAAEELKVSIEELDNYL